MSAPVFVTLQCQMTSPLPPLPPSHLASYRPDNSEVKLLSHFGDPRSTARGQASACALAHSVSPGSCRIFTASGEQQAVTHAHPPHNTNVASVSLVVCLLRAPIRSGKHKPAPLASKYVPVKVSSLKATSLTPPNRDGPPFKLHVGLFERVLEGEGVNKI